MKVLLVNYEFPPIGGGAGRGTYQLARHLPEIGVETEVLTSIGKQSGMTTKDGITLHLVPTHRRSVHHTGGVALIEFLVRALPVARRLVRRDDFDIIHYFFSVPTGLLSFAVAKGLPYVVSLRGGDVPGYAPGEFETIHRILSPLNRCVWRRAAAVVALSQDLGNHAARVFPELPFEVVHNGVDTELFRPSRDRPVVEGAPTKLICVSRLTEWKGIHYLLQALNRMKDLSVELVILGTGAYEAELRELSRELGLSETVTFVGPKPHDDLPEYYRSADVFVLPSYGESFGQVFTEAMACGLPVVAADHGGVPEFVRNGIDGFLVTPRSEVELEQTLRRVCLDRKLRESMGRKNAERMRDDFSWKRIASEYKRIYGGCVGDRERIEAAEESTGGRPSTTRE